MKVDVKSNRNIIKNKFGVADLKRAINDIAGSSTIYNWTIGIGINGNTGAQEINGKVAISQLIDVYDGILVVNDSPPTINGESTNMHINKFSYASGYISRVTNIRPGQSIQINDCDQIRIQAVLQTSNIESVLQYYDIKVFRPVVAKQTYELFQSENNIIFSENAIDTTFISGRYLADDTIGNPRSHSSTLSSSTSFRFDEKFYMFYLKPGYKVAFPGFKNGVFGCAPRQFMEGPRLFTLDDIIANFLQQGTGIDSFAIMIRRVDDHTIQVRETINDIIVELLPQVRTQYRLSKSKWYAIGDSITDGRCSYFDDENVAHSNTNHYNYYGYVASRILNMNPVIEYGYGGMGWIHVANDGTYLTDVLAMNFENPDLITVCLGVNDTGIALGTTSSTANDGTISGGIRNCCEILGSKYKSAQIVFLSPLNSCKGGNIDTGWMKNHGTSSLNQISEMIKYWCDKYGFCFIDMLHDSPINDFNIQDLIPDTLHPSVKGHELVGKYLASVLPHRN